LKNGVFWDLTPCIRTDVSEDFSASFISSPILVTLMKEALSSSETSVLIHGVTSQKKPFFIVTAVKTSNLTSLKLLVEVMK
jgi:hypothetical protein